MHSSIITLCPNNSIKRRRKEDGCKSGTPTVNRKLNISAMTRRILRGKKPVIFLLKFPRTQIPDKNGRQREKCFSRKALRHFLYFFIEETHLRFLFIYAQVFLDLYLKATQRTTLDSHPLLYVASTLKLSNSNRCLRFFFKYFSRQIYNYEQNHLF